MLAASSEPSAEPAPTSVCSSSMKTMAFWLSINSFMMVFSRSSNCPRYFVPATIKRKIERQDALVRQKRRHVAVGDALRQAFDDRRLAHARFADQHRIVLRAAAEDLNRALQLAVAAHERVELAFHRRLRQVAAEFREQRSFFWPVHGHLLSRAARQFLAHGGKPQSALEQNFGAKGFLFAQDPQQQMLGADVLVPEPFGFFGGVVQDALAFLAQRDFHRGGDALAHGDARFDFLADGFDRAVRAQKSVGQRLVFAQQAEQQVLGLDVRAAVLARLVPREKDHAPCLLCIAFKHGSPTLSRGRTPALAGRAQDPRHLHSASAPGASFPCSRARTRSARRANDKIMRRQNRSQMMGPVQDARIKSKMPSAFRSSRSPVGSSARSSAGLVHQGPRDCHALLFATRKFSRTLLRATRPIPLRLAISAAAEAPDPAPAPRTSKRHRHVFRRREIRQQVMPLPDETHGTVAILGQFRLCKRPKRISRRSILHRSSECPARPANAEACFSRLPMVPRSRSSRRARSKRSIPSSGAISCVPE